MRHHKHALLLLISLVYGFFDLKGFGQTKAPPTVVSEKFAYMFPQARNIEWMDKLNYIQAFFLVNNAKCETKFDKSGNWISTEMQTSSDSLPVLIKQGFQSSKYSGCNIQSVFVLYFPNQANQYRIVATKADGSRRILSFDQKGQLQKDNLSL